MRILDATKALERLPGDAAAGGPQITTLVARTLSRLRGLGPTLPALFDQAVVSGGSFATTALIGRFLGTRELGAYTLLVSCLLFAAAVQDATIATSYTTRRPELDASARRAYAGGCMLLSAAFAVLCGILAGLTWPLAVTLEPSLLVLATTALLVPAILLREQIRRYEFACLRMGAALRIDGIAVGLQLVLLAAVLLTDSRSLATVFGAMLIGNATALAVGLARRRHEFVFAADRLMALVRDIAGLSGWVLLALLLFVAALQIMPWLVAARLGIEAAGAFAACAALAHLGNPLLTGVINAMMPAAARAFASGGPSAVLPAIKRDIVLLAVATGSIAAFTLVYARPMLEFIFGPAYAGFAPLACVLTLAFFFRGLGAGSYVGCWALRRPAWNAAVNLAMLAVAATTAFLLMPRLGVSGAGIGLLAGDVVALLARWTIFLRLVRRDRP